MGHFYFLIGLGILVLVAFLLSLRRALKQRLGLPYVADETLFSGSERAFKGVLERAVGKDYQIYGKVRAIDVIALQPRMARRDQERALQRLDGLCFDFLVCGRDSTVILCAVNLAPRSRLRKPPPKDVLDRICAAARLPFVRFRESDHYSVVEIEERIFAAMQARGAVPKGGEMSAEERDVTLHALSSSIQTERRGERAKPRQKPSPGARRQAPVLGTELVLEKSSQSRPARRRDPTVSDSHVFDEGPTFRIEGDVEEERSLRLRTR